MDTQQKNVEAQKRWGEIVATGELDAFDEVLADDFTDHDPGDYAPTREGLKAFFTDFRTAFPDLDNEVVQMHADGDWVTMRYTLKGTHEGPWRGHAPTGRSFEAPAMQVARFRDGKCVERWGVTDQAAILEQLGLLDGE